MKKTVKILPLLLALLMLMSACGSGASAPAEAPAAEAEAAPETEVVTTEEESDTLRVLLSAEPSNIVPQYGLLGDGQLVATTMYDTLLSYDSDTGEISAGVATSWEFIDDYHIRLTLRDDVIAYDGTVFNAYDVLYSVKVGTSGPAAVFWKAVDFEECSVEDEFTFILGLNQPYPTMTYQLVNHQMLALIDESSVAATGSDEMSAREPKYTTGAYFFDEWKEGEYIRLVRNDDYWGEKGYYKYIEFRFNSDNASRVMALAAGEADFAMDLSSVDMQSLAGYPECKTAILPTSGTQVLYMNITNEYLSNPLVREAIYYALNAEALNMIGTGGVSRIADGPYEASNAVYSAPANPVTREVNIEKAKQLMAEAGYADGFSLRFPTINANQTMAEAIQADLGQIGIDVKIEIVEMLVAMQNNDTGNFDISIAQTFTDDPVNICNYIDDRMPLNERGGGIVGGLEESYDIIDRCRVATGDEQKAAYAELQDFVRDNYLLIPFYDFCMVYGTNGDFDVNANMVGMLCFNTAVPK